MTKSSYNLYFDALEAQRKVLQELLADDTCHTLGLNRIEKPAPHGYHSDDGWDYLNGALQAYNDLFGEFLDIHPDFPGHEKLIVDLVNRLRYDDDFDEEEDQWLPPYASNAISRELEDLFNFDNTNYWVRRANAAYAELQKGNDDGN